MILRQQTGERMASANLPMRVLFVMRSAGFLRNFDNALRALSARGHAVTIAIERGNWTEPACRSLADGLARAGVTFVAAPARSLEPRHRAATQVRLMLDYLRYLAPGYDAGAKLRARACAAVLAPLRPIVRHAAFGRGMSARMLRQALAVLHETAPISPSVEGFLDEHPCDLMIVTPLVELGGPQTDWVRAARRRGIRSALAVASWDNLTVKGRIREPPDRVFVWNEPQRAEATRLHGFAAERVVVIGAHAYDHWLDWAPSRDRTWFCSQVGLRADRPIVLYACSSPFIAPDEAEHVGSWIEQLRRSSHTELRDAGILVRPHPQHAAQWSRSGIGHLPQVSVWPACGADPVGRAEREDFYDSIHHCAVVVGVNTSAMIECSIVGRRVLTLLTDRYAATQGGTPHFAHLADPELGVLAVASTPAEHHAQLARAIAGDDVGWEKRRAVFLNHFVRPHGSGGPAAPRFVVALEDLARIAQPAAAVAPGIARESPSPMHRCAVVAWRRAPLATAFALADRWTATRVRRRPVAVAQGRVGPDIAATARGHCVERFVHRLRALS